MEPQVKRSIPAIILTLIAAVTYLAAALYIAMNYVNSVSFALVFVGTGLALSAVVVSVKKTGKACIGALVTMITGILALGAQIIWVITVFLFGNPGVYLGTIPPPGTENTVQIRELSETDAAETTLINNEFAQTRCYDLELPAGVFAHLPKSGWECRLIVQLGTAGDRPDMLLSALIDPVATGEDLETAWQQMQEKAELSGGEITVERLTTAGGLPAFRVNFPFTDLFMVPTSVYFVEVPTSKFSVKGKEIKLISIAAPTKLMGPGEANLPLVEMLVANLQPR